MRINNAMLMAALISGLSMAAARGWTAESDAPSARKLPWGAGVYGAGSDAAADLDRARWDWVACHSGDAAPDVLRAINRRLKINPRQKYLFQLTGNFLSIGLPEYGGQLNFIDYHFDAKLRKSLCDSLQAQVRDVINGLSQPQNIAAFTFYEELPGNWGATHLLRPSILRTDKNEKGAFPSFLKPYQKQIEQERGKPLVWDEETWRYLGDIYTASINDIHHAIKTASGGKPVYYWLHNGMATLDQLPADWTFEKATGTEAAYRLSDIIRPGLCEGVMVYPSCVERCQQLLPLFEKNHWLYFAQLWHPGAFRLDTWDATVARTMDPNPWNQGFFFYCEGGGCARPSGWNDPEMAVAEAKATDRFLMPVRDAKEGPAMRIVSPSVTTAVFNHQYFSEGHPDFKLQGGTNYRWSVRIKTRDVGGSSGTNAAPAAGQHRGAAVFLRWFSKTAQIGPEVWLTEVAGTHDWQTYTGSIVAPADTVGFCIFAAMWQAAGEALFTGISLKAEGDNTELISNGNFEKFIASPLKFDNWYHVDDSITRAHCRYFCNKHHVGDDVVANYFKLAIALEKPASITNGRPFQVSARVTNTRDTLYYLEAESATAKDVEAVLKLPPGIKLVSGPKPEKANLAAGASAVWQWSVAADKPGVYTLSAHSKCPTMPGTNVETTITVP